MADESQRTDAVHDHWTSRVRSAGRRRLRHWWRLWGDERYPMTAQRAGAWLVRAMDTGTSRITTSLGDAWLAAEVLRAGLVFGLEEVGAGASGRLLELQRSDGSLPGAGGESSRCATGHGLVAWLDEIEGWESSGGGRAIGEQGKRIVTSAARRAAAHLFDAIDAAGRVRLATGAAEEPGEAAADAIIWLAALFRAGQVFHNVDWQCGALHAADRIERRCEVAAPRWDERRLAQVIEGLLELGREESARRGLLWACAWQQRGGGLKLPRQGAAMPAAEVARWARLWYRAGQLEPADRAMAWLARHQQADGSWLNRVPSHDPTAKAAGVARYLLSAVEQVRAHFRQQPETAPAELPVDDPRRQWVRGWLAELAAGSQVADAGCGRGPFMSEAGAGGLRWYGIDPLREHLAQLPAGVKGLLGSLLRLPLADGAMDAVLAVESLEHSLDPQRAVGQLCRVVRAGGRILIVDKDRRRQDLSDHAPWERWFTPCEVADWLRQWCDDVRAAAVTTRAGGAARQTGFIAWTAVRRPAVVGGGLPGSENDDGAAYREWPAGRPRQPRQAA